MNGKKWLCVLAACCAVAAGRADVKLAEVFGDNMVLQRDKVVPVWGWAAPGEKISVSFSGQTKSATADEKGLWLVKLDPLKASAEPHELTVVGAGENQKSKIENVVVGDVWLCAGQSNMAFLLRQDKDGAAAAEMAADPLLRRLNVGRAKGDEHVPATAMRGTWEALSPANAPSMSAVAYYFGRELRRTQQVPVGLIRSAVGGSKAQRWTDRDSLAGDPGLKKILEEKDVRGDPCTLFNSLIAPLQPLAIKGAIWYQGESNGGNPGQYEILLPAMIAGWRRTWARPPALGGRDLGLVQDDFPFLFVQLPNFKDPSWVVMRETMARIAQKTPHVGMAVSIDVGMENNIHPTDKLPVGERLARVARAMVYGEQIECSGPVLAGSDFADGRGELKFTHLGGGLVARGGVLQSFEIAGADRNFVPAEAKIVGDTVVVRSAHVAAPAAVRYAWSASPAATLFNAVGLPAMPFRTDQWDTPVSAAPAKKAARAKK